MNHSAFVLSLSISLLAGCKPSAPKDEAQPAVAAQSSAAASSSAPPVSAAAAIERTGSAAAAASSEGQCGSALDAIASCALAKTCDEDISMFLPAANRSALIALEADPAYSAAAFDRYCLTACQSRSSQLDEAAFEREVCAIQPALAVHVVGFSLRGKLQMTAAGLPLAEVVAMLGEPVEKRDTPHDCGSAFSEGQIEAHVYPGFTFETDGQRAVLRSVQLADRSAVQLSDGQTLDAMSEAQFKQMFGARAQDMGEAYRVSASPGGDFETAYDFLFDDVGNLSQVKFWIAC